MSGTGLTAYNLFHATMYYKGSQCGRPIHIQKLLEPHISEADYTLKGLEESYDRLNNKWQRREILNVTEAQQHVALLEVGDSLRFCGDHPKTAAQLVDFTPTLEFLVDFMKIVSRYYQKLGLPNIDAEIFLVDELPAPYSARSAAVLAADKGDYKNHGITPGLYFLRKSIRPVIVNYLIAHEAIHAHIGKISPYGSCGFFEEGLADLLCIFGCIREVMGGQIFENIYLQYRLTSASGLIWDSYVDGSRKALSKVVQLGLGHVVDFINQGRPGLRALEEENAKKSFATDSSALEQSAIKLLMEFPRSHVVSAQAYLLAQHLQDGMAVAEAASLADMSIGLAHEALDELDNRAMVTRRKDGLVVTKAICRRYIDERTLRYDFR